MIDPDNPVVRLCAQGMQAELEGRDDLAAELFRQAWNARRDDFEGCVAAHYLARHQPSPDSTLHWNAESLRLADRVSDERVQGFYPSLHLSLGKALEDLGRPGEARWEYERAAATAAVLPAGGYGDLVRHGIRAALARTEPSVGGRSDPKGPAKRPART